MKIPLIWKKSLLSWTNPDLLFLSFFTFEKENILDKNSVRRKVRPNQFRYLLLSLKCYSNYVEGVDCRTIMLVEVACSLPSVGSFTEKLMVLPSVGAFA